MSPADVIRIGELFYGGLWQTELARALDRSARYVSFIKSGQRPTPDGFRRDLLAVLERRLQDHARALELAESPVWTVSTLNEIGPLMYGDRWKTEFAKRVGDKPRVVWDISRGDAPLYDYIVKHTKKLLNQRSNDFSKVAGILR